ncbi:acyltransferase [Chryseosolibacter indicus]|uniref:Acyltransferase n=1 Tax=Chryseosolibacter indicus TaxID=2782351 RepID=A0ABS5VUL4_9BACT|nr:acyltransferase [Chryseosolibacter indicus]
MIILKTILRKVIFLIYSFIEPVNRKLKNAVIKEGGDRYKKAFKYIGSNYNFGDYPIIVNPQFISIGDNFISLYHLRLEAISKYNDQVFSPEIVIGNNVIINPYCHIGCTNRVVIGNDVLLASKVFISDHFHGTIDGSESDIAPAKRKLNSKGPVIIEDKVWLGENVVVMSGVTIGKGSIIGANAVVTRSVPPYAVAVGVPAKVTKFLK